MPPASGIADHLHGIAAHRSHRCRPGENCHLAPAFRRVKAAFHALDIAHGTAEVLCRNFQTEGIPWLQQLTFCHHQTLPHCAVGRLPEVAALRVLEVGAACNQCDLHIGQRRTGQHTKMLFFFQMGQHKALPVFVQHFFPAVCRKLHSAAPWQRFQLDMHFCIVAQGLIVPHALHRLGDGLLIQDTAGPELHVQAESLCQQAAQHLQLDLAHELYMDLAQSLAPHHMQLRFFLLHAVQFSKCCMDIRPIRQQYLIAQHRLQHRDVAVAFCAKPLARASLGQAGDGTDLPRLNRFCQRIFCA